MFWNFKKSVIDVCTGIDSSMLQYFKEAMSIDDIVEGTRQAYNFCRANLILFQITMRDTLSNNFCTL